MQKGRKTLQTDTHVLIYSWEGCSLPARWTLFEPWENVHPLHIMNLACCVIYHTCTCISFITWLENVFPTWSHMGLVLTHRFAHRLLLRDLEWCWKCAFPVVDMMLSHVNNWFTGSLLSRHFGFHVCLCSQNITRWGNEGPAPPTQRALVPPFLSLTQLFFFCCGGGRLNIILLPKRGSDPLVRRTQTPAVSDGPSALSWRSALTRTYGRWRPASGAAVSRAEVRLQDERLTREASPSTQKTGVIIKNVWTCFTVQSSFRETLLFAVVNWENTRDAGYIVHPAVCTQWWQYYV